MRGWQVVVVTADKRGDKREDETHILQIETPMTTHTQRQNPPLEEERHFDEGVEAYHLPLPERFYR